ncbi:MAG TPA: thioredoxin domain-containing protein [Bacteriovoracaceae bacterium]|nr:thioredoxin domain-containing protein [Bacteriovoracaceae bacterium]
MAHTYSVCKSCRAVNKVDSQKGLKGQAVCGKCKGPLSFHGLVSNVTTDEFTRILKASDRPVIVNFWAEWCGPCKMYGPEFEKASTENVDAVFLKVNTETEQQLSSQLGIKGIPCTIIYKSGVEAKRQAGAMNSSQVKALLT